MESLCLGTGIQVIASTISMNGGGGGLDVRTASSSSQVRAPVAPKTTSLLSSRFSFKYPLRYFWPGGGQRCSSIAVDDAVTVEKPEHVLGCDEDGEDGKLMDSQGQNGSWVLKILHANRGVQELGKKEEISSVANGDDDDDEKCDVCRVDDGNKEEQDEIKFDRDSFSRLLRKVPLAEAKLYAKLSYLGDLTYSVSKIQPENLLRYYRLQFVTSSLEKRELLAKAERGEISDDVKEEKSEEKVVGKNKNNGYHISASTAYQIAASAASYLHSQTKSIIPFKSSEDKSTTNEECVNNRVSVNTLSSNMASLMATTDSVTAVVAAKEDVKQAVADDLNSISSSPCEWFICDDEQSGTRFFVIQGSESLASWQANLLFEPIQFEGLDTLVHRGIYEAARGIYEQMLPEIRAHMQSQGERATFRFTGHSLGGSLALLINLMLLIRGEVPLSSLLPVITFGAPYVMCGGDHLLNQLGLPKNHFQSIALHRDIVPRAFSAHLSNHIVELLKAVNGKLRTHPCLNNQRFLYAPMGELLILQPDEKYSPHHDLLPHGSGLYLLNSPISNGNETEKLLKAATKVFLNQPHPLEILSDRGAYGSEGTIVRDHDMKSYLKSIRGVIRQDLNKIRKAKRERRRKVWWPLVSARHIHHAGFNAVQSMAMNHTDQQHNHFNFSGILQTGRDSFKRFSRLVASQHMHLLVVLLFPARLLLFGTYNVTLH